MPTRFDTKHFCIVKGHLQVFQETLSGPPPHRHIKHVIELKGSTSNARPIYKLTPADDEALRAHLVKALEKGLI